MVIINLNLRNIKNMIVINVDITFTEGETRSDKKRYKLFEVENKYYINQKTFTSHDSSEKTSLPLYSLSFPSQFHSLPSSFIFSHLTLPYLCLRFQRWWKILPFHFYCYTATSPGSTSSSCG